MTAADRSGQVPPARPAGSDTREAVGTASVRLARLAALFAAGPGWAAILGSPAAWRAHMHRAPGPWLAAGLAGAAVAAAIVAWRRPRRDDGPLTGVTAAVSIASLGVLAASFHDSVLATVALPAVAALAGWTVGDAARIAASAVVAAVAQAAAGVVAAFAILGVLPALHLTLVASRSGMPRGAGWAAVYATLAAVSSARAAFRAPADRRTIAARSALETTAVDTSAVSMRDITVRFGATTVLRRTTMRAGAGELVALVGPNGAGKSTLLRVAAGLLTAGAGRVSVGGEDVTGHLPEERAAAGIAFVSGAHPVFPDLTVAQNLRVAAFRSHRTHRSFTSATEAVLDLVPTLAHRRDTQAGVLSGGEQRLLAVAQTLYTRPAVLLVDELTLGLEASARVAVLDLLRMLAGEGVAVVAVDHDLQALLPRADRALLLVDGGITEYADPVELLKTRADLLPATFLAS
jgi:branched-chain amino acid transport system ATP-binding protein